MNGLTRYWFRFEESGRPWLLGLGCGVTAYDEVDARRLLEDEVYPVWGRGVITDVTVNIDVQTLDQGHVIPNMAPPNLRGLWFPRLR